MQGSDGTKPRDSVTWSNRHGNIVKNKKGRSMVTALSNKEVVADTSNADMGDGFS